MRILIIDDDRDFADSLAELLQLDGHHVELALSGEMGVELFRATQFDKVFIDIKLGDQNGLEILAILKAERPDIDASLITGSTRVNFPIMRRISALRIFFKSRFPPMKSERSGNSCSPNSRTIVRKRRRAAPGSAWRHPPGRYPGKLDSAPRCG
jgi:CheY-like chemotaxis protein